MMKIGVCVVFSAMEDMDAKFKAVVDQGFDNCQLVWWNTTTWSDENADTINELVKKYGLTISAFWCGWDGPKAWNFYEGQKTLGLVPPEYREMRVKNLCDGADFAKKLGVENVVTHMGYIPENPFDPEYEPFCDAVRTVAEHLKANGQYLLFETGQETPVTLLRAITDIGTGNLGINLDTANLILYGKANPLDSLEVFGQYVMDLHVKDGLYPTDGWKLGEEVAVGEGKVDFPAIIAKLKELGYTGALTIEREISGEKQVEDILKAKALLEKYI